jgi:putative PIN family toxin of toxin-antitoxin system
VKIGPIIELLTIYGEIVDTEGISVTVCEDPDDNMFLECAIASNCKVIISGDKHLLKETGYQGIDVFKPRDFIDGFL